MTDALAVLPQSMGQEKPGSKDTRIDPHKYIPEKRGGLLLKDPKEEQCPYTFKDSPAYVAKKKYEESMTRAVELESKDETRGFLRSVEELGKKHKWDEAYQVLERRTAVPSGLFLVTRAVLRWKLAKYQGAIADAEEALRNYSSSAKAGPLAAAFSCFLRICVGSQVREQGSCSKEMQPLVAEWEEAEQQILRRSALGQGLFHPRTAERLVDAVEVVDGYEAHDGVYVAASGVKISYVLLKNIRDLVSAPVVVHFHGSNEVAADYRTPALAEKYRGLGVHLLVVDYRGYGWSSEEAPSLATFLRDSEPFAENLGELFVQYGFAWPYSGGLVLSGRSLGAQVAVHLATMFPTLFRYMILDSAMATSATGDRLGRAPERNAALECWKKELEKASLEVLQPLATELWVVSALEKIRAFDGELLVLHGLADELVPFEGSESLHAAAATRQKELVLVEEASHNNIGHYDAYWSAQKRFFLKVQLNDTVVPSIGKVQHLCAVCAEKAVSKCGRCQKVWYCGRKHQAEHWKTHKLNCGDGPPEPKPKVEAEGEACLVVVVTANLLSEIDASALSSCLSSLANQTEPLNTIYLSWYAETQDLASQVPSMLDSLRVSVKVVAKNAPKAAERFEHASQLAGDLSSAPAHAWVAFAEPGEMWSSSCSSVLMPALRKAAVDMRINAASCRRRATATSTDSSAPSSVAEVGTALEAGAAVLLAGDAGSDLVLGDYVVKVSTLRLFLETTPPGMLSHELCTYRFLYKLNHTYGKKVREIESPADSPWLHWEPRRATDNEVALTDADKQRGKELSEGFKADESSRFSSADAASKALAVLRRKVEKRMSQWAGEKVTNKELRETCNAETTAFLAETGLDEILGMQRWAREAASQIAEIARQEFSVVVSSE